MELITSFISTYGVEIMMAIITFVATYLQRIEVCYMVSLMGSCRISKPQCNFAIVRWLTEPI